MPPRWPGPRYEIRTTFRAPVDFVYRWCTDYTVDDARYEKDEYERWVVRRSSRKVVFEDLSKEKDGWVWSHHEVRLDPPLRWHSDSVGSHRAYSLDYRLRALPGHRTELTLRARRRPYGVGGKNPAKGPWEANVRKLWRSFGHVLERDYQRSLSRRARK